MNIELELKQLLRRTEPSPGFSARVMERVVQVPMLAPRRRTAYRALAAAALIAATLGAWGVHATLRARNDLLLAMRITSEKVAHAQQQVRAASR